MSDPGSADLSADVDFSFLKEAIVKGSGKIMQIMKTQSFFFFFY
jgi:SAM-dependent MidA family methyltransferase